jgi:hypothetical protein
MLLPEADMVHSQNILLVYEVILISPDTPLFVVVAPQMLVGDNEACEVTPKFRFYGPY